MPATITVQPISGALGAELRGIDLATLTDTEFETVHELLLEYQVLFFPDQGDLPPAAHIAFGRRFGEVELHPYLPKLEGFPEIVLIESDRGGKVDCWHTDMTFHESPPLVSILQLTTCPPRGGDTMWTNQYLVYERLSAPLRDLVDGLTAVHSVTAGDYTASAEHPLVRVHPETGRRSLYVNRLFTSHIPQLSRPESDALLQHLVEFSEGPQFTCRFRWQPGAVALWDNRVTQHYAVNDYDEPRRGRRVTVLGDHPEGNPPRWPNYTPADGERYWPMRVNAKSGY
ncbi:TauD/TfdA family dioxygenase [Nocardia terpenica]|uniref:Taurine dioxygenase n=1 Tax=Nocardia terpenica TaxID=455432 RepID=A0A164MNM8_9NOCA|nr:TauD/TfdA family dioxygenase [Nocardia terpenica]KZM73522.1 taurine dioxygenase [Nocardia terpenica]MBF6065730.1 TauD/TfdA family dioxygenase [Nocardia terpenica]MBF6108232.1 TauD/TfdA family dioxygenase [Nocardia terpenica]MBF6115845.1 TauD/TfdA family dioxygenase [Nocardia terpenica]MBF6122975.1 TauD/TfdA family dioxygenase [Nocardia terpenica]